MPYHSFWKGSSSLRRLSVTKDLHGKTIKIGHGKIGDVHLGRAWFGKKPIRVAIKIFKQTLTDEKARRYQEKIDNLVQAGVKVPKMFLVKMPTKRNPPGEWVLISRLFGSTKLGSKITGRFSEAWNTTPQARSEAIIQLTKIANAGYLPALDIMGKFTQGTGTIPIDLDYAMGKNEWEEYGGSSHVYDDFNKERAHWLLQNIRLFSNLMPTPRDAHNEAVKAEMQRLRQLCFQNANAEIKNALEQVV